MPAMQSLETNKMLNPVVTGVGQPFQRKKLHYEEQRLFRKINLIS